MSKAALDILVNEIANEIAKSKSYRDQVDRKVHTYTVDSQMLKKEILYQVSGLFNGKIPKRFIQNVGLFINRYVLSLEKRAEAYGNNSRSSVSVSIEKGENGFVATLTGKVADANVFAAINTIRLGKIKGGSPLGNLREDIRKALELELGTSDTKKDIDTTVYGSYQEMPNGQIVRSGGLLQSGHVAEHAISARRYKNTLDTIKGKDFESLLDSLTSIENVYAGRGITSQTKLLKLMVASIKRVRYEDLGDLNVVAVLDESSFRNLKKSKEEKDFLNSLNSTVYNYLSKKLDFINLPGSNSIADNVRGMIIKSALKQATPKSVKGKVKTPKASKGSVLKELSGTLIKTKSSESLKKSKKPYMLKVNTKSGGTINRSLLTILNQTLRAVVAENMVFPRLQFKTGRFANSVQVVNIIEGSSKVPEITYSFMHDPYDVFRMDIGNHLATPTRDPRSIIDLSIRQIAAKFAIRKLITRVV